MRKKTFFKGVLLLLLLMVLPGASFGQLITGTTATASTGTASAAVDGNAGTRWESAQADPQWIIVDLGAEYYVGKVSLVWEGASASAYTLEGSTNGTDWTVIDTKSGLTGARTDEITGINATFRYVKMNGTARSTGWGYSIWEFKVYQAATPVLTTLVLTPAAPIIKKGESQTFTLVGKDQNGDPFALSTDTTWSVDGTGCSIDDKGILTSTINGVYTVTVTNATLSATATLTVYTPELTTLNITPQNSSVTAGNTLQFDVTGKDQQGIAMDITSKKWSVRGGGCTIDEATGLLTTAADATGYFHASVEATAVKGVVSKDIYFSVGNYAVGATATATSDAGNGNTAAKAVDGLSNTRWESVAGVDPQSVVFDLGGSKNIGVIRIMWEGANAKDYTVSFSNTNNGTDWADVITKTGMPEGARADMISALDLNYRYIKVEGTARNLTYGYSIFEFEVYGKSAPFLSSLAVTPATATIIAGETSTFSVGGLDQGGNPFTLSTPTTWSVLESGCTIDANGVLTSIKPGIYTVKASNNSLTKTATIEVLSSDVNIATSGTATASTGNAALAIDGLDNTRWESASVDPTWIQVDLGAIKRISGFRISWEAANSKNYTIEGSVNGTDWTVIATKTNMAAGARIDGIYELVGVEYRYIKLNGTARNLTYGHSIFEFKIYETNKTATSVVWANPADITYGDLLSATQLNATETSSIPGSFVYTPALGTKLNAEDAQELKVDFIPTDNLTYGISSKTVLINVKKKQAVITWENPEDIFYGDSITATQQNATADADGTFAYSAALDSVLNVGDGQDLTVVFTSTDPNYLGASKTVKINVKKANPVFTWDSPEDIFSGTALSATQLNANTSVAGTYVYTPALGAILPIGDNQVLAVEFTPNDLTSYEVIKDTVYINVLDPGKTTPVLTWANPADITYGTLLSATQLNATVGNDIPGTFTYTPAIGATVNAGSLIELKVAFTPTDASLYNTASKTVKINVAKATPAITWENPAAIVYGTLLSATQLNASTGNVAGTFTYTPAIGAKLNAGVDQELKVSFHPTDLANYNVPANKTVKISVSKVATTITWAAPADITYGDLLSATQLNATFEGATGTLVYVPAIGAKLNAGAEQELKVVLTPTDTVNFSSASQTAKINVAKATPVLTWAKPAEIAYGTKLSNKQLNASAGSAAGVFVYAPAIDALLNAGNDQELKVDFTPTDAANYNAVSASVKINVAKATPVITWSNPNNIKEGTALSATQLNASSDAEGTLVYSPAAGTVLGVGNAQELKVDFTPTDVANYNSVSKTVKINVTPVTSVASVSDVKVQVYPNPFAEKLLIKNAGAFSKVVVIDLMGKVAYTSNIQTAEAELPLSNLRSGNYFIVLTGNNAKETLSIIKK